MKRILTAALALSLLGAGAAMAQDRHDDHRGGGSYRGVTITVAAMAAAAIGTRVSGSTTATAPISR